MIGPTNRLEKTNNYFDDCSFHSGLTVLFKEINVVMRDSFFGKKSRWIQKCQYFKSICIQSIQDFLMGLEYQLTNDVIDECRIRGYLMLFG